MECLQEMSQWFNVGRETIHLYVLYSFLRLYLPNNSFYTPRKNYKTKRFINFSEGIKMLHWEDQG